MTKTEFMTRLADELRKARVTDAGDILEEYEQHFAFKLADGYSEEEIAAKLGDPAVLAVQFAQTGEVKKNGGNKPFVVAGLCMTDLVAGLFFLLLIAWGVVMAAACLASGTVAVCLLGGFNPYRLLPPVPYWCGAILAFAFAALAVLAAAGSVYYAAFLRQLFCSFGRFQHNALAAADGKATLPALAVYPQLPVKTRRRLRAVALAALALFAVCFVLAYVACSLSAGSLEFWHAWGWFAPLP